MFRVLIQTVTFIAASSTFSAGVMTAAFYIVPSSSRAAEPLHGSFATEAKTELVP
ncbi:hypothetical protein KBY28_14595 [Ruegeria pomeroyi]|uniref:hypothetical protein n=1 Tax=Ruegeria pomeroyi TaxID=89184 RepID=UPI001F3FC74E|nr:hypothetical protein [Ruegeria pomeroyi]MCE8509675.1 hypothetical protein [Ruegeria pomeroyi]